MQDRRADRGVRPYGGVQGVQWLSDGRGRTPPLRRTMSFLPPGRCGERTERRRWRRKRSERVAAVKISSVRRKAAQKFWAPQQDHRPLRRGYKRCGKTGRRGRRPLRKRNKKCRWAGRCGERTERCQWQRERSERVAAVKILSVRRKVAQKFWAPQQDHRPLRRGLQGAQRAGRSGDRPYEILRFGIFSGENFLRQGDSVISRLFSSGLPSTMGETKEGIA